MYLGIDTSNYTTSVAGLTVGLSHFSLRTPIPVAAGARGIRQSDAVFEHVRALPPLVDRTFLLCDSKPAAIAVSNKPRDADQSYMPCFIPGVSTAQTIAAALSVPLYTLSHQRGHVLAALYGANRLDLLSSEFAAFHVSGGTTELLMIELDKCGDGEIRILCSSADLNAGQLIDRCGIMLGFPFPCGAELERLAENGSPILAPIRFRPSDSINLSGLENKFAKHLTEACPADAALWLLNSVASALCAMAEFALHIRTSVPLLLAGGVLSNKRIQSQLGAHFETIAVSSEYATDNAIGCSLYAALQMGVLE